MLVTELIFVIFDMLIKDVHPLKALTLIFDNEVVKIKSTPVNEEVTFEKALAAIEVTVNNSVAIEIPEPAYVTLVTSDRVVRSE